MDPSGGPTRWLLFCACVFYNRAEQRTPLANTQTPQEALQHPYVSMFHNEAEEVNSSELITIPLDDNTK